MCTILTLGLRLECDSENECVKNHGKAKEMVNGFNCKKFLVPSYFCLYTFFIIMRLGDPRFHRGRLFLPLDKD